MTDPDPEPAPRRSSLAAAVVVGLSALGVAAALLAWILPAARGGDVSSLPGWVHTLFPVLALALSAMTGARFARPTTPARGRHARILVYAAALSVVLQVLQFSPFVPATFFLALSTGLAIGGGLVQIPPLVGPGLAFALDLTVGTALLLLVGSETALRLIAWNYPGPLFAQVDADAATHVARHALKPGQLRFGFPANDAGFQDDPPPQPGSTPAPVVVLGDQSLWGMVPHELAPTTVAERNLGGRDPRAAPRPFVDLALPDLGPADYLWLCEQVALPLQPAAVVIALDPYDDLQRAALRDDGWRRVALCFDRRNVLLTALFDRAIERAAWGRDGAGPQAEAFRVQRPVPPAELATEYPWLAAPEQTAPTWSPEALARVVEARARLRYDERAPQRRAALFETLRAIAAACAEAGVPCAVLLIPGADRIDPQLQDLALPLRNPRAADLFTELVTELRARGIPTLDATPTLRAAFTNPDKRPGIFHSGDLLVGPRGAELLGETLAALVRPLLKDE